MAKTSSSHRLLNKVLIYIRESFRSTLKTLAGLMRSTMRNIKLVFYGLMLMMVLLVISLVLWETYRDTGIMLEPISMPQELADMGYTPEIMARRLIDSTNVYHAHEVTNINKMMLTYKYHESDIVVSEVGISIKSVASYFRDLIGRNITSVSGEMLYHKPEKQIYLRLRLNSEQIFNDYDIFSEKGITTLLNKAGYMLTKEVKPFALALYHYKNKEEKKALEIVHYIYKTLNKDNIDFVRAVNLKGVIHHFNGEYEEAISQYKRAIEFDPSYATPYNNWGGVLAEKGDYHGAIKKFKEAIKADAENASAYVYWCGVLAEKENSDWKGAIKKCEKAVTLDPNNVLAYIHWGIALANKTEPDWQGAIKHFMKALELEPNNATAHFNLGIALMRKSSSDWQGAIEHFIKALELEPNNVSALINLGTALTKKTEPDWQGAIEHFMKALKLDPNNVPANMKLGISLMNTNQPDWQGAIKQFEKVLNLESNNVYAHIYWGDALMRKRHPDWQEAIEQFKKALKLDPNNVSAHIYWGDALTRKRHPDWQGAMEQYKKVIELNPLNIDAYSRISAVLMRLDKHDIVSKILNCMNNIDDNNNRLKCPELVLSL